MSLKKIVGTALFIFLVIVGNILLFGLLQSNNGNDELTRGIFFGSYVAFSTILFAILTYTINNSFERKSDLILFLVAGLIICFALTTTASSFKTYHENMLDLKQMQPVYEAELSTISQNNDYYSTYIHYLRKRIDSYQEDSARLQDAIDKKISVIQEVPPIVEVIPETYVYYQDYIYEDEGWEEWYDD